MSRNIRALVLVGLVAIAASACSIEEQKAPGLTGPSSLALSVTMTATPSQLPLDGSSQSVVTVAAMDASGTPLPGLTLSLANSAPDAGVLSQSSVVTGSDGRASFAWVSTRAVAENGSLPAGGIVITATPTGSFAESRTPVTVAITPVVPGGSNTIPTAAFTFAPASPEVNATVAFDAGATTDEGRACGSGCTYAWDFNDGTTATGITATHAFTVAKTYRVTLTATDARGTSGSTAQDVTVVNPPAPTAAFTVNPSSPTVFQQVTFDASSSRVASGHRIVSYAWSFDDGTSDTTSQALKVKTYSTPGTYVVRLTVTDDVGQSTTTSVTVPVSAGLTVTVSPTAPLVGQTVTFTVTGPTAATPISVTWDFGDGTTGSGASTSYSYAEAGNYIVRVTVTDAAGRTSTTTQSVTVSA